MQFSEETISTDKYEIFQEKGGKSLKEKETKPENSNHILRNPQKGENMALEYISKTLAGGVLVYSQIIPPYKPFSTEFMNV